MAKYIVLVREIHYSHRPVDTKDEVWSKPQILAAAGNQEEIYLEYSDTCDQDT